MARVQSHTHRDGSHNLYVHRHALRTKIQHGSLEARRSWPRFLRPMVRIAEITLAADLEALLQVWHRLLQLCNVVGILQLRRLLPAWG